MTTPETPAAAPGPPPLTIPFPAAAGSGPPFALGVLR